MRSIVRLLKAGGVFLGGLVATMVVVAVVFALLPLSTVGTGPPSEMASVDDALAAIEEWQAEERLVSELNPDCASRFINSAERADRVVVLFHGFTNCPAQWSEFAESLAADGWSVVIPRMPGHGLTNDERLAEVTAEELADAIQRSVGIAGGLGERVAVAGLSSGGVFAAWAGTTTDVDLVVSIAPAFTLASAPGWASGVIERSARVLPNMWLWWDGDMQAEMEGPEYAYKRFPTRAYGQIGRLGQVTVRSGAAFEPERVVFLLNPEDPAVNNDVPARLGAAWAARGWDVTISYFPSDGLPHDVVDPHQPGVRIEESYPIIQETLIFADNS